MFGTVVAVLLVANVNVMYVQNGEIMVGKVVKKSGTVTYVTPCTEEGSIKRWPVQRYEIVDQVQMTCQEFRDIRNGR